MTIGSIAKTILDRRSVNPIVMSGEMRDMLGAEGFQTALDRRWITPDAYTGMNLMVTDQQPFIEEMRGLAESEDGTYKVGDTVLAVENGQVFNAVVQGIRPDGSYILSFGDKRPTTPRESYKREEVRPIARPETHPNDPTKIRRHVPLDDPNAPQGQMATTGGSGVRGPGIG